MQYPRKILQSCVLLAVSTIWTIAPAVSQEGGDPKSLPFSVDYAKFKVSDDLVQLEVFYSLFRRDLSFLPSKEGLEARFGVEIWITRDDSLVAHDNWMLRSHAADRGEISPTQKVFTQTRFRVAAGAYRLRTRVTDLNSNVQAEKAGMIRVATMPTGKLTLSDIELSSQVSRDTLEAIYVKNGLSVVPNPSGIYGLPLPLLYSYTEIYNLHPSPQNYNVTYSILDEDKKLVKELPTRSKPKAAPDLVEVGGINVVSLATGRYYLRLTVTDEETGESAATEKRFFVYKKGSAPVDSQETIAEEVDWRQRYQDYSTEQLDTEFEALKYIADKSELEGYKKLDINERRAFLQEFWTRRDPTPGTSRNEARDDFLGRLRYAEENFGNFGPGLRSDRGRVLLIYGKPDEIERYPSSGGVKAYEIWRYFALQGGVDFVFVDRKGWGDLQLVHSTARGEISDPDWTRWINTN